MVAILFVFSCAGNCGVDKGQFGSLCWPKRKMVLSFRFGWEFGSTNTVSFGLTVVAVGGRVAGARTTGELGGSCCTVSSTSIIEKVRSPLDTGERRAGCIPEGMGR